MAIETLTPISESKESEVKPTDLTAEQADEIAFQSLARQLEGSKVETDDLASQYPEFTEAERKRIEDYKNLLATNPNLTDLGKKHRLDMLTSSILQNRDRTSTHP